LATGLADKAVALFYERRLHATISEVWASRCRSQIEGVLAALDADRAARVSEWWFGRRIGHADIAAAVALRFIADVHEADFDITSYPALARHATDCEALDVFKTISQPFIPPA
jgi:glutathione S-transferase